MHQNVPELLVFFFWYLPLLRYYFSDYCSYHMRAPTSVDNTVNDLRYEIKFENCVKDKNNFFINRNIAFLSWTKIYFILGGILFKIPKNLVTSAFLFFTEGDTKKHRYALAKASNAALVKLTDWIIKNDHVINSEMFFTKWLNMAKEVILFHSPQHGFYSFAWRLQ